MFSYGIVDWKQLVHIGDRIYSGFILFRKDNPSPQSGLVLDSIILEPGIVISTDKKF